MIDFLKGIKLVLEFIRCFPHLILFYFHKNRKIIRADTLRWMELLILDHTQPLGFIFLLSFHREFRNLFYYRIGLTGKFLNIICPKLSTLFIVAKDIGEGFFIQHGFATGIHAESIGRNCWINQQVSIGFHKGGCPTILDNVTIRPGAVIIGKVTIGNNVVIGANATVFKDIPDNCTVFPASSTIIRWGKKISVINPDDNNIY